MSTSSIMSMQRIFRSPETANCFQISFCWNWPSPVRMVFNSLARLRAHKNPRVQNLPAVVITLLESPGIFRRAARQKVGAFLKKPISRDGLRIGMEEAFKGNIVEKPFSKPKSWLDEFEEDELLKKQEEIKAKAAAKIAKKDFWYVL